MLTQMTKTQHSRSSSAYYVSCNHANDLQLVFQVTGNVSFVIVILPGGLTFEEALHYRYRPKINDGPYSSKYCRAIPLNSMAT